MEKFSSVVGKNPGGAPRPIDGVYTRAKKHLRLAMYVYTLARIEDIEKNLAGLGCKYRFDSEGWDRQDNHAPGGRRAVGGSGPRAKLPRPMTISQDAADVLTTLFHAMCKGIRACSDLESEQAVSLMATGEFKSRPMFLLMVECYESHTIRKIIGNGALAANDWYESEFEKLFGAVATAFGGDGIAPVPASSHRTPAVFAKLAAILAFYLKYLAWHAGNFAEYAKHQYVLNRGELYPMIISTQQHREDMDVVLVLENFEDKVAEDKAAKKKSLDSGELSAGSPP